MVCTTEAFPDLMIIKKKIEKEKLPTLKAGELSAESAADAVIKFFSKDVFQGTVTDNIGQTVRELHLSKEFTSSKISDDKGIVKIKIGTVSVMIHSKNNFLVTVSNPIVCSYRPKRV